MYYYLNRTRTITLDKLQVNVEYLRISTKALIKLLIGSYN